MKNSLLFALILSSTYAFAAKPMGGKITDSDDGAAPRSVWMECVSRDASRCVQMQLVSDIPGLPGKFYRSPDFTYLNLKKLNADAASKSNRSEQGHLNDIPHSGEELCEALDIDGKGIAHDGCMAVGRIYAITTAPFKGLSFVIKRGENAPDQQKFAKMASFMMDEKKAGKTKHISSEDFDSLEAATLESMKK